MYLEASGDAPDLVNLHYLTASLRLSLTGRESVTGCAMDGQHTLKQCVRS